MLQDCVADCMGMVFPPGAVFDVKTKVVTEVNNKRCRNEPIRTHSEYITSQCSGRKTCIYMVVNQSQSIVIMLNKRKHELLLPVVKNTQHMASHGLVTITACNNFLLGIKQL